MPRFSSLLVFLSIGWNLAAQMPILNWVKAFKDNNTLNYSVGNNGRSIGVDSQGNVYTVGLFMYSMDFDPGPGVYSLVASSPSNYGIYISKLDANGNFVWAKQIPTLVEWGAIELEVAPDGTIYLASQLRGTADMDPGPSVLMMSSIGFKDAFIAKIDKDGNLIWVKKFGGPGDTGAEFMSVAFDQNNNVIIGGLFNNTIDVDPGPGVVNMTSTGHQQSFIVKLNSNGDYIWAHQFGNGGVYNNSNIRDLKCDPQGNIITVGGFAGVCDFDPGPSTFIMTCSSGSISDGFICKWDADGNLLWAKSMGQSGGYNHLLLVQGVALDRSNNIITTGYFIGNFDLDPGPGVFNVNGNPFNCFISKLDATGNFVWGKQIAGQPSHDTGNDVAVDMEDNVYIAGSFERNVDFDPGPGVHIINSPYYGAAAIVKLNPAGNFVFAAPFQSISYGSALFRRLVVDHDKNIYVTGYFSGIMDYDPGPDVFPFSSGAHQACYVLKLSPCPNFTYETLNINACANYTLNGETYDSTGTYVQTIPNATGCDSIITLNLTINSKRTEQNIAICQGQSYYTGGSNQLNAGIYYDTLQTVLGCDSIVKTTLVVNPKPSLDLGADKSLCRNTPLTLSPGTFTSYTWQDNSTTPTFTVNAPGTYWVTVTNSFNCATTDTFKVAAIIDPPANFLETTDSVCSYSSLQLVPAQTFSSYQWSTGSVTKVLTVEQPGIYSLTVIDVNGCSGTDSTTVFSKECMSGVFIPTGFTPDNNGKNDIFKAQVFGTLQKFRLTVYNRWGTIVFQSADPGKGWDGKLNGIPLDNAVFVWVCSYQLEGMKPRTEKGTVTLVR